MALANSFVCVSYSVVEVVIVVLVALFVDFWWASGGQSLRMSVLEEHGGAVVGVSWPLLSGLASGPLGIFIAHFWL